MVGCVEEMVEMSMGQVEVCRGWRMGDAYICVAYVLKFVLYYVMWIHPHPLLLPSTSFTPPLPILLPSPPYLSPSPSPLPSTSFTPLLPILHPSTSFTSPFPPWALQVNFTTFLTITFRQGKISKRLVCQPLGHEGSSR